MLKQVMIVVAVSAALLLSACCKREMVKKGAAASEYAAAPAGADIEFRAAATHALPPEACATSLDACPDEGCGGGDQRDPGTNVQKNRTSVPTDPIELTVADFKHQFKELTHVGKSRESVSAADQQTLDTDEAIAVQVDGFVLDDSKEGVESCSCYLPDSLDYHIWLGSNRTVSKADSIVVEITPRIFATTDPSIAKLMKRLKEEQTHVRVVGWAMFDPLHPEQLGKSRFTRWEVHPVVDIQEKVDGGWKSVFD